MVTPLPPVKAVKAEQIKAVASTEPRTPLPNIDVISSPYLDGILDAADSESLLVEFWPDAAA